MSCVHFSVSVVDAAVDCKVDQHVDPGQPVDQRRLANIGKPPRRVGDVASDRVDRDHLFHRVGRRQLAHEELPHAVGSTCHGDNGTATTRSGAAPWANRLLFGTHRLPRTTTLDGTDVAGRTHDWSCLFPVMEPILPEEQR